MYKDEGKRESWDAKTWARVIEPGINYRIDYAKDPWSGRYTPQEIALVCFGRFPVATE